MKTCNIEGCARKYYGRGYCNRHWQSLVYAPSKPKDYRKKPMAERYQKIKHVRVAKERFARTGATQETVDALLAAQQSKCLTCSRTFDTSRGGKFVVDHCHASGEIRGLLCSRCNIQLGLFEKFTEVFSKFPEYVLNPPARKVL